MIYLSTWHCRTKSWSAHFNSVGREHPFKELKQRRIEFPEDDWVLLNFWELPDDCEGGYYAACADENSGEMMEEAGEQEP